MFEEIIEKLLVMKASLATDKATKIEEAVRAVEEEFAVRETKIDNLLTECGYVAPVEEEELTTEYI
jgi:hypothetical protein